MTDYTKDQTEAMHEIEKAYAFLHGTYNSLSFMEERFGKVNTHVIEFRKNNVEKARKRLSEAQSIFHSMGGN